MAKFFIDRPIFAIVLSIMITLAGLIAGLNLPIAQYPQIQPPTVRVSTNYIGANADVVNQTVAQVIEQEVNGVEGMVFMNSTSSDTGSYSLSIQFEPEVNSDIAAVQTQNRVAAVTSSLPADVQQQGVTTVKASQDMSMIVSLYSPNNVFDTIFLKNYADIYMLDDIKRVKGVGDIRLFGADFSMRIWLKPDKMAELGLTVGDIKKAVEEQNVQAPAGIIGNMPAPETQQFQYTGRVQGRLVTAEDFENVIVAARPNGAFVRLKDVARVETGGKDYSVSSSRGGQAAVGFGVYLTSDANALETIGKVQKVIDEAAKNFPPGMAYETIVDNTKYIRESIIEVLKTFGEAMLLVMLVMFLFLQSWRATLIPMLAVPVSLVGTFAAFMALGFTINTLTLFAMVLAIGLVVDDAIVVIEAAEHHIRYSGLNPKEATKRAMAEVSGPIVAIAFVLASVFIPVAFFGGTMGILYKQFALTVAVSMALSAVVALSLTPALCALMLKSHDPNAHKGRLNLFFAAFNHWFDWSLNKYTGSLGRLIPKARLCVLFLIVVVILTAALYRAVPSTFVPDEDQGFVIATVALPEGSSMNRTKEVVTKLSTDIMKMPGVERTMEVVGFDLLSGGSKPNAGAVFIGLKPWGERTTPATQVNAYIGKIFADSAHIPEASILALNPPSLPGLGIVGGFTLMLEDRAGHSDAEIDAVSKKFVAAAQKRPEIGRVYSTFRIDSPGYEFHVNRDKVKNLGISLTDVFTTLQANMGGVQVNDFNRFGRTYKVVMQAESDFRDQPDNTRFFYVKSASGAMAPLDTLLTPEPTTAPSIINRFNGVRSIQINGSAAPGYSSGQAIAALEETAAQVLPEGYTYEWSGQSREEKIAGNRTMIVFGLALVFVFLCLAALYESWSVPYAVLLCVPTGVFGALLFQFARNLQNSIYMQIGLIMLIGLAAKNAILIVEFAKVRVDKGMDPVLAAIDAAKLRLRPIIMTSLAFIIGCVPLAIATGAGAGARNSMGTAVVGGMLMATMLGIFLIPVMFVVVEKVTAWGKSLFKMKKTDVKM